MDELKLDKWRKRFNDNLGGVKISFEAFFYNRDLEEYCALTVDETSNELVLKLGDELPEDIKERLTKLLIATKPEDSI
jgi:hypothetical protein